MPSNPDHVFAINKGVQQWNNWRLGLYPSIEPDLEGIDLSSRDLTGVNFSWTDLHRSTLRGAVLNWANLVQAWLTHVDLRDAELNRANCSQAWLAGSRLSGASLLHADLSGAYLDDTDFAGAEIAYTRFGDVDLSSCKGLSEVQHLGPSIIGIDTLFRSHGNIPEVFLNDAGVPPAFVEYARSLAVDPVQFYSCFISYSTKDQEVADHVNRELRSAGVRCWLATEELKVGDKFRTRIDQSIKSSDRLLLILSDHAVASSWVESEVEAALEKERIHGDTVLFPVRVDDSVMDAQQPWAAEIRRTRHIGDLRRWTDPEEFRKTIQRLLRDLRAGRDSEPIGDPQTTVTPTPLRNIR